LTSSHANSLPTDYKISVSKIVAAGGFGARLNAITPWHDAQGIPAVSGQSLREKGHDIIRWCFADLVTATLFQKEFGEGPDSGTNPPKMS
jgi:hypothetical protein